MKKLLDKFSGGHTEKFLLELFPARVLHQPLLKRVQALCNAFENDMAMKTTREFGHIYTSLLSCVVGEDIKLSHEDFKKAG